MMRIVAGTAKGRRLVVPPAGVRPTPDRVREALFSSLASVIVDADVLDLFAGSGAVGLEALSRGARSVAFVEHDRSTAQVLQRNIDTVGLPGARLHVQSVERILAGPVHTSFTVVYCDAPYAVSTGEIDAYLALLTAHLAPRAIVIVERDKKESAPTFPAGFTRESEKRYGTVVLYRARWMYGASVNI